MMNEQAGTPAGYAFGPFRLDRAARELYRDGETLPLTAKAFDTLLLLVSRSGRVVEKEEILNHVWPDTHVSEDSLTQSISVLRRALGEDASQPQFVATVPRRGYRFVAPVTVVAASDAGGGVNGSNGASNVIGANGSGGVAGQAQFDAVASSPVPASAASTQPAPLAPPASLAPQAPPASLAPLAPAALPASPAPLALPAWLWRIALLLGVPIALVLFVLLRTDAPRAIPNESAVRFQHLAWPGTTLASSGILAPDGRHLVFTARDDRDGRIRLWVRSLDSSVSRALAGTENAFRPFWSPDGESIAFFADGRLKKVGLDGAPPQTLATVGYRPSGGTWSREGVLLYADRMSRIYSVSAAGGGKVTPVTTLDRTRQEVAHYAPQFLPDGRHFLFVVDSLSPDYRGTFVASLDDPSARNRLLDGGAAGATFAPPEHLVYVRDQTLMAQPFDAARLRLAGTPASLGSSVASQSASISAAAGGLLTFGGDTTAEHLVWFDRNGHQQGVLPTTILHNPQLSPDERQIVGDNGGVWLLDLERGAPTRIADGMLAGWTADGGGVVYTRRTKDAPTIVVQAIAGESDERVLVRSPEMKLTGGWSRDGRYFFYVGSDPETRLDLWRLGASAEKPQPFLRTEANEMQPALSPDGNWIAYTSDETGAWEVYVQSFPLPGAKRAISVGGGAEPQWTRNGHEIVYLRPDGTMMAVDVTPSDAALQPGRPRPLFRTSIAGDITTYRNHYVVTADGQRFLVNMGDESTREPINVVVHWQALLNR